MENHLGILFVISSPSGGGKSTIIRQVRQLDTSYCYSVSATTRKPRKGEKSGVDYYFMKEKEFHQCVEDDKFLDAAIASSSAYIVSGDHHLLELAEFHGVKIITPREFLKIVLHEEFQ